MAQKLISVIISIYNEQENISIIEQRLRVIFAFLAHEYEFIFVNDGSKDRSWQLIQNLWLLMLMLRECVYEKNSFNNYSCLQ